MSSNNNDNFHDFNSFQRVLRNRNIDGHVAIILTELYVQLLEISKQMDLCANICSGIVETISNFTELHNSTQSKVQQLINERRGNIEVHSQSITDESDYN